MESFCKKFSQLKFTTLSILLCKIFILKTPSITSKESSWNISLSVGFLFASGSAFGSPQKWFLFAILKSVRLIYELKLIALNEFTMAWMVGDII